jgi:hypothetical protein
VVFFVSSRPISNSFLFHTEHLSIEVSFSFGDEYNVLCFFKKDNSLKERKQHNCKIYGKIAELQ